METLAENFRRRTGIPANWRSATPTCRCPARTRPPSSTSCTKRLTNIAKHAGAKRVEVAIEQRPTEVVVNIRDDSRGFAPQQPSDAGSLGLIGVRERAFLVGGDATIMSAPGKGTSIELRLPIRSDKSSA